LARPPGRKPRPAEQTSRTARETRLVQDQVRAIVEYAIEPQPAGRDVAQQCLHWELVVKRLHARLVLEEVDLDDPRALLEFVKEREWILDMLDHIERERRVEAGRHAEV
jgi:hypothetical protein